MSDNLHCLASLSVRSKVRSESDRTSSSGNWDKDEINRKHDVSFHFWPRKAPVRQNKHLR